MLAPAEPREPVEIRLEPDGSRLFVALRARATGQGFAQALARLYREQPHTAYVDKLYDLTDYRGVVTQAQVMMIVEAYTEANTNPRHPCRTAFVTLDPNFALWAKAMSHLFPGREHRCFPTFAAAESFLAQPMAERAPFTAT